MRLIRLESTTMCDECQQEGTLFIAFDGPDHEQVFVCVDCCYKAYSTLRHAKYEAVPAQLPLLPEEEDADV